MTPNRTNHPSYRKSNSLFPKDHLKSETFRPRAATHSAIVCHPCWNPAHQTLCRCLGYRFLRYQRPACIHQERGNHRDFHRKDRTYSQWSPPHTPPGYPPALRSKLPDQRSLTTHQDEWLICQDAGCQLVICETMLQSVLPGIHGAYHRAHILAYRISSLLCP